MFSEAYLRTRIADVQHEFATARRWRRRLRRVLTRVRGRRASTGHRSPARDERRSVRTGEPTDEIAVDGEGALGR